MAFGFEQRFDVFENSQSKFLKISSAMVENLARHSLNDPVRNGRGAWNLEEVTAGTAWDLRHSMRSKNRAITLVISERSPVLAAFRDLADPLLSR